VIQAEKKGSTRPGFTSCAKKKWGGAGAGGRLEEKADREGKGKTKKNERRSQLQKPFSMSKEKAEKKDKGSQTGRSRL